MKTFIGTKTLNAKPMTLGAYNELRGWDIPANEDPEAPGYLVEYADGGKANHPDFAGYISWSPVDVFERSYRPTTAMTFGDAIIMLKAGKKVARAGWNGKGMWLSLSGKLGGSEVQSENFWSHHNRAFAAKNGGSAVVLPSICMKNAADKIVMGWTASQEDMLAEDWTEVP